MMTSQNLRKSILLVLMAVVIGVLAYEITNGGLNIYSAIIGVALIVAGSFAYRKISSEVKG